MFLFYTVRGEDNQYTRDWDLSNYSRVIEEFEKRLPLTTPWYQQSYQSILSKVRVANTRTSFEYKQINQISFFIPIDAIHQSVAWLWSSTQTD